MLFECKLPLLEREALHSNVTEGAAVTWDKIVEKIV